MNSISQIKDYAKGRNILPITYKGNFLFFLDKNDRLKCKNLKKGSRVFTAKYGVDNYILLGESYLFDSIRKIIIDCNGRKVDTHFSLSEFWLKPEQFHEKNGVMIYDQGFDWVYAFNGNGFCSGALEIVKYNLEYLLSFFLTKDNGLYIVTEKQSVFYSDASKVKSYHFGFTVGNEVYCFNNLSVPCHVLKSSEELTGVYIPSKGIEVYDSESYKKFYIKCF